MDYSSCAQSDVPGDRSILLSVDQINALTQRGVWSRLGFSAFVASIACAVISWEGLIVWLGIVLLWEILGRGLLEYWTRPACDDDASERSLRGLAMVHALGATIYAILPALGFLSHTTLGAEIAMGWIGG